MSDGPPDDSPDDRPSDRPDAGSANWHDNEPGATELGGVGLEPHLRRRLAWRQRAARAVVAGASVVLVVALLLAVYPDLRVGVLRLFPRPSTSASQQEYIPDYFFFDVDAPWATVTLDGKVTRPPVPGREGPLRLARGRHLVRWSAEPFLDQQCVFTVPRASGDTCEDYPNPSWYRLTDPPSITIRLRESLETLPTTERDRLAQAIAAEIAAASPPEAVRPGESYRTADGIATARGPVQARLSLSLLAGPGAPSSVRCQTDPRTMAAQACVVGPDSCRDAAQTCARGSFDCRRLCSAPEYYKLYWYNHLISGVDYQGTVEDWLAFAVVSSAWRYTGLSNDTVAPLNGGRAAELQHLIALAISYDRGAWRVRVGLAPFTGSVLLNYNNVEYVALNPVCVAALDSFISGQNLSAYQQVYLHSGRTASAGCALRAALTGDSSTTAEFLERFGIFYALNGPAHHLRPDLPVGGELEQRLAVEFWRLGGA